MRQCPNCYGKGGWNTGTEVKTGMGGSFEVPIFTRCDRCGGEGEIGETDPLCLHDRLVEMEKRIAALEAGYKHLQQITFPIQPFGGVLNK